MSVDLLLLILVIDYCAVFGYYTVKYRKIFWVLLIAAGVPLVFSTEIFLATGALVYAAVFRLFVSVAKRPAIKRGAAATRWRGAVLYYCSLSFLGWLFFAAALPLEMVAGDALSPAPDILAALTAVSILAYFVARNSTTFPEEVVGLTLTGPDGGRLTFRRALLRYVVMLATFPLGFGLINFLIKEPLYNSLTGTVEFRNEMQGIKYGVVYRGARRLWAGRGKSAAV